MPKQSSIFQILKSYNVSTRRFRWVYLGMLIAYGLASFTSGILSPLVYRHIIDTISGATDRAALAGDLFHSLWMLVAVIVAYQSMYRTGDVCIGYAESKTMEDLNNRSFQAFMRQGHGFFIDRFSGSLVAQARRYTRTLEDIVDSLIFHFWMPFIHLAGVIGSLLLIKPLLAVIFLVWIPLYISIAIWITKKKLPYDKESATQDSAITARFSDVLSNIFAVKTFASEQQETTAFAGVAQLDEQARWRTWRFNNILIAIQTILFGVLEIVAMYVVIRLWIAGSVSTGTVVLVQVYIGSDRKSVV